MGDHKPFVFRWHSKPCFMDLGCPYNLVSWTLKTSFENMIANTNFLKAGFVKTWFWKYHLNATKNINCSLFFVLFLSFACMTCNSCIFYLYGLIGINLEPRASNCIFVFPARHV